MNRKDENFAYNAMRNETWYAYIHKYCSTTSRANFSRKPAILVWLYRTCESPSISSSSTNISRLYKICPIQEVQEDLTQSFTWYDWSTSTVIIQYLFRDIHWWFAFSSVVYDVAKCYKIKQKIHAEEKIMNCFRLRTEPVNIYGARANLLQTYLAHFSLGI